MEKQHQHRVVKAYYQVYEKTDEGWFLCKLGHEAPNHAWLYGLTPSKIVIEFFRLQQGMAGYYCVNLRLKKYYYCGFTLESVWQKLLEIKGLCHDNVVWAGCASTNCEKEIFEKEAVDLKPTDKMLIFEFDGTSFRPIDMKSLASSGDADFGISWKELQQKFLSLNGGKPGFYCYGHGEANYFKSADLA